MSNLWSPDFRAPREGLAVEGETLPAIFRNAVAQRGDAVFMRQKKLGLWHAWTWAQTGASVG
jgi:long-chain acyl-CoA synthetase